MYRQCIESEALTLSNCCLQEGDMGGGFWTPQHRKKKIKNTASPQEKLRKHRHHNNFSQNKCTTLLFILHTSTLLVPVNQFSWSWEEIFRGNKWRKKEKSRVRWPLLQILLFFYFAPFSCCNLLTGALSCLKVLLSRASSVGVWYW